MLCCHCLVVVYGAVCCVSSTHNGTILWRACGLGSGLWQLCCELGPGERLLQGASLALSSCRCPQDGKAGGGAEAPFGMPGMQGRKRPPSHSGRSNGGKPSKISQLRDRATKAAECAAEAERRALALEAERSAAQQRAELAEKQAAEAERRATAAEAERSAIQQHAELADKQAAELRSRLSELERQLATAEAEARENKELVVHIAPRPASWPL